MTLKNHLPCSREQPLFPLKRKKIVTWCIYADEDGDRIWAGSWGTGLRCYSKRKGIWQQFYFKSGAINREWATAVVTIFGSNKNEAFVVK